MATETEQGSGWITFAGIMILISGFGRLMDGIWALRYDDKLASAPALKTLLVFDDNLSAWGWFYLILGVVLLFAGFGIFSGAAWARWVGVISASIGVIAAFAWVYAYPIAALVSAVLNAMVVYGLAAYGERLEAAS
jgi:hypothetical protein